MRLQRALLDARAPILGLQRGHVPSLTLDALRLVRVRREPVPPTPTPRPVLPRPQSGGRRLARAVATMLGGSTLRAAAGAHGLAGFFGYHGRRRGLALFAPGGAVEGAGRHEGFSPGLHDDGGRWPLPRRRATLGRFGAGGTRRGRLPQPRRGVRAESARTAVWAENRTGRCGGG